MPSRECSGVFLDRDGTLNVEVNYLHRVEDFIWIPGAPHAIARLNRAGFPVIVITNQAAVAHGYCGEEDVRRLHAFMQDELAGLGARIDAFYYCPFHPDGRVAEYRKVHPWRKPGTGMFEQAIEDWRIDPAASFMVGDRSSDLEPARKLGMRTFLVETGYGLTERDHAPADVIVSDICAAVDQIVSSRVAAVHRPVDGH